jgi:hypothetical protein
MPRLAAVVTALILERPLCIDCIATKASVTPAEVRAVLITIISDVLLLHFSADERCRGCGTIGVAISFERLSD